MTKAEYLNALREKLDSFNQELQQEIMEDYERHFAEGAAAGRSEEELVEELGSIEDMIQELSEGDMKQQLEVVGEDFSGHETYDGLYKAVVVNGLIADVILEKSVDGRLTVDYHNNGSEYARQRYRFYQYERNGTFYVGVKDCEQESGKRFVFGKIMFSYNNAFQKCGDIELCVRIPEGIAEVEASVTSGDMEIRDLNVGELVVKTGSGDITLSHPTAQTMKLQAGSADIEVSDMVTERLVAGTGSGDIELGGKVEECVIKTGSGDVVLRAEGAAKSITVQTGSGDVEMDLTAVDSVEISVGTGSGECTINGADGTCQRSSGRCHWGSGDCKVNVSTGSGDVEIECR